MRRARRAERMRALQYFLEEAPRACGAAQAACSRSLTIAAGALRARRLPDRHRQPAAALRAMEEAAEFSVYLSGRRHAASSARPSRARLRQSDLVAHSSTCRRPTRCARFKQTFGDSRRRWTALERNPLPASFEVRLQPRPAIQRGGRRARRRRCEGCRASPTCATTANG